MGAGVGTWSEPASLPGRGCSVAPFCLTPCDPMDCSPPGSSAHGSSLGKNSGAGCHALLQEIFLPEGWNSHLPCVLHWQVSSLPPVPPGKSSGIWEVSKSGRDAEIFLPLLGGATAFDPTTLPAALGCTPQEGGDIWTWEIGPDLTQSLASGEGIPLPVVTAELCHPVLTFHLVCLILSAIRAVCLLTFSGFPPLVGRSCPHSEQLPVGMRGRPCPHMPEALRWGSGAQRLLHLCPHGRCFCWENREAPCGACSGCFCSISVSPGVSGPCQCSKSTLFRYWVLISFGKHQVQSLVDSGQGLPRAEAGSSGHFRP